MMMMMNILSFAQKSYCRQLSMMTMMKTMKNILSFSKKSYYHHMRMMMKILSFQKNRS